MPFAPATVPSVSPLADEATPINLTLTVVDTAEDLASVPTDKRGRILSIVNEGPGIVYLAFDADATTADTVVKKNESYSENDLDIASRVSFIGESGKTPHVRGILWSA